MFLLKLGKNNAKNYTFFLHFKPETYTVNVFNFEGLVCFKVLAEAGDKNIETSAQEIVVFSPKCFQNVRPLNNLIGLIQKIFQQIGFPLSECFGMAI